MNFDVLKFGKETGDILVEGKVAVLDALQCGHSGQKLRAGPQPKESIELKRLL